MVAKKKKVMGKKPAQKAVKKAVKKGTKIKSKVSPKKVVKKPVKKVVKKTAAKQAAQKSKAVKPSVVKPAKKAAKKSAVGQRTVVKTTKKLASSVVKKPVKKAVPKLIVKKSVPEKTVPVVKTVARPVVAQSVMKPSKPSQATVKKQTTIEQSKKTMTEKMDRESRDEMVVAESTEVTTRKKPTTLLGALEFTPYQPKPDEHYMSDHQREHFRRILGAWKQQLMQDVDLTVGHLKEDAVFYADPVDRAAQEEGFNLELRTRDRERKLIKKIEQSLDLINMGEYGHCEDCGAEIGIRRLEARPTAVKCIDCKTFQEIREKQLGG